MASAENSNSNPNNLLSQFEKAYAETMATLAQEDTMYDKSPETVKAELEAKITKFTDLARQMETFFLQKQFLLYAHKPELHLKDESTELRQEITRKDELIKKHNERLSHWLKMLQDLQQQQRSAVGPSVATLATPSPSTAPSTPGSVPSSTGPKLPSNQGFPSPGGPPSGRVPGSPAGPSATMSGAGPLQFLEKTTTNIGNSGPR